MLLLRYLSNIIIIDLKTTYCRCVRSKSVGKCEPPFSLWGASGRLFYALRDDKYLMRCVRARGLEMQRHLHAQFSSLCRRKQRNYCVSVHCHPFADRVHTLHATLFLIIARTSMNNNWIIAQLKRMCRWVMRRRTLTVLFYYFMGESGVGAESGRLFV